jgi:rhodanese-related sulfurtransferase
MVKVFSTGLLRGNHMKRIIVLAVLTAVFLIGASACSSNQETVTESATGGESSAMAYKKISAEEAKTMIDAGNVIILDVRTQEEYDAGHIEGALRLESADFGKKAATVLPDKAATILVYCRSGNRSKTAAKLLLELGYTNVYDFGGINDWPYETVK